jgi:hypothetical protein
VPRPAQRRGRLTQAEKAERAAKRKAKDEEAKAQLEAAWRQWLAWAKLREDT